MVHIIYIVIALFLFVAGIAFGRLQAMKGKDDLLSDLKRKDDMILDSEEKIAALNESISDLQEHLAERDTLIRGLLDEKNSNTEALGEYTQRVAEALKAKNEEIADLERRNSLLEGLKLN